MILALLLMLAVYAMGRGWSALSGDSSASETQWISFPGNALSTCVSLGALFPCLSSAILLPAAKGRCPVGGAFFISPFGLCERFARPGGDRFACVASSAVPDRTLQLWRT